MDYWPVSGSKKDRTSLKTAFRSLTVHRLPGAGDPAVNGLTMEVVTKEKNKKSKNRVDFAKCLETGPWYKEAPSEP